MNGSRNPDHTRTLRPALVALMALGLGTSSDALAQGYSTDIELVRPVFSHKGHHYQVIGGDFAQFTWRQVRYRRRGTSWPVGDGSRRRRAERDDPRRRRRAERDDPRRRRG